MATSPKSAQQIKDALRAELEKKGRYTEGLVSPTGDVAEIYCPPPEDDAENGPRAGDVQMAWINGAPRILKKYEDLGYQRLVDVCRTDGCPERHDQWKAAIYARIVHGLPIRGDVTQLYPPTVMRLRALHAAGGVAAGKAFVIGEGVTDDPMVKRREVVAELLVKAGAGDPRLTPDPPEPKKGRKGEAEARDG